MFFVLMTACITPYLSSKLAHGTEHTMILLYFRLICETIKRLFAHLIPSLNLNTPMILQHPFPELGAIEIFSFQLQLP